jgi:4-hydroxy-3-methylbut-2-enyl diphosphate reductase
MTSDNHDDALLDTMMEGDDELDEAVIVEGGIVTEGTSSDYDRLWDSLAATRDARTNVQALVVDAVKGGLVVDIGVRGFIPKSQIASRDVGNLDRYIGQTVDAKIVEVDREKARVILSERKATEELRAAKRTELMATLEKDMVLDGVVCRVTDFGAFVDIGGVDGLLHVSDISWEGVRHPSDALKVGDEIRVKVLKLERGGEGKDRISLGLKQLEDDPWTVFRNHYGEGDIVEVEIMSTQPFGAFAKIARGVEGLIPMKELADRRIEKAEEIVKVGDKVTVRIQEIRFRERRISLSIRAVAREEERKELREYMTRQREELAAPTLGDLFGDVFSKFKKD